MAKRTKALAATVLFCAGFGCSGPDVEARARAVAADIEASIQDYDTPALEQEIDPAIVKEVQTHLTALKQYMGEINGEIDPVLINAIQAFQRRKNDEIPWWRRWQRTANDGLLTDALRDEIARAAG